MVVYMLLRCLCVMWVFALLTFWSVHGECVFSRVLSWVYFTFFMLNIYDFIVKLLCMFCFCTKHFLISIVKPTRCTNTSNLFYFGMIHSTCFGQTFHPSSGVQDCTYSNRHLSNRYCCLLASKTRLTQRAWLTSKLVHLVDFTIEIILRCMSLWMSNFLIVF